MNIREILYQRTDLSTFLVHLTRDEEGGGATAKDRLASIICSGHILAASHFGIDTHLVRNADLKARLPKVVCFTETPLQHVKLLTGPIEISGPDDRRQVELFPYGIGIPKLAAERMM